MGQVQQVLGPIDADRLGVTLMHEHVFILSRRSSGTGRPDGTRNAVTEAVDRLNELSAAGVSTIVDLTVVGLGRNVGS